LLTHRVSIFRGPKDEPYHDETLKKLKRERDLAYENFHSVKSSTCQVTKDQLWNAYKQKRNNYVSKLRACRKKYFATKIDALRGDSKGMWKTLQHFVKSLAKQKMSNNIEFTDKTESMENNFNNFFVQSIETLSETIIPPTNDELALLSEIPSRDQSFKFHTIDETILLKIIKNLKFKAVPDNINLHIILNTLEEILPLLLDVVNTVIVENSFPDCWKIAMVVPIPKVKNSKDPNNYRPINILPLFEKILEIVMSMQITKHIEENQILCTMQSGFRKSHSCESTIQSVISKWRQYADEGLVTVAAFLDFKRAFETIDRERLLDKLAKYGFKEESIKLIRSFLTDRKQYVHVNDKKSSSIDINIGVPQGSVLGPLLFILYINDLPLHLREILISIFADDTLLAATADTFEKAANKLNQNLKIVTIWLKANKVKLNVSKTKCLVITMTPQKLNQLSTDMREYPITIEGTNIEYVSSIKYLGVKIDNYLKFDEHIDYVIEKASTKISYLGRLSRILSKKSKILIYNCIVAPHFEYCASVLWGAGDVYLSKLQILQNRGMRSILNSKYDKPINEMLTELGWLNVKQKLALSIVVLIKKIINKEVPNYLCDEVQYSCNIHEHKTRRSTDFFIPAVNSSFAQKSLFQSGLKLYNSLPSNIKNVPKTEQFKKACTEYFKMSYLL
jgi:hypothetical protein